MPWDMCGRKAVYLTKTIKCPWEAGVGIGKPELKSSKKSKWKKCLWHSNIGNNHVI